jgi:MFS family permease
MISSSPSKGMRTFLTIWLGQLISVLGSGLTGFALSIWVLQQTGSATLFSLMLLCATVPELLLSPFAGALVDRWDRRYAMILGDSGAALSTAALAAVTFFGELEIWHLLVATTVNTSCSALQKPAYKASVTQLVPKEHFGRASGMIQIAQAASQVLAPIIGGILIVTIDIEGVLALDLATFFIALLTLLAVRIPKPADDAPVEETEIPNLLAEIRDGWRYISSRPGLVGMLVIFGFLNVSLATFQAAVGPIVMGFSSAEVLGTIVTVAGCGMFAGSVVMSAWGGPKRRIHGVAGFGVLFSLAAAAAGTQPSAWVVGLSVFVLGFCFPILAGCSQAIWQVKTNPRIQGRVFSLRSMVSTSAIPIAYLATGLLTDRLLDPLLAPGGAWADVLGPWIGVGPGRGAGLLLIGAGLLAFATSVVGFLYPRVRFIEDELPDQIDDEPSADSAETDSADSAPPEAGGERTPDGNVADPAADPVLTGVDAPTSPPVTPNPAGTATSVDSTEPVSSPEPNASRS